MTAGGPGADERQGNQRPSLWPRPWVILSLIWLGFCVWFWLNRVPLKPTCEFRPPRGMEFVGWTKNSDLILARKQQSSRWLKGPLEIWRLPEKQKIAELFEPTDRLENAAVDRSGRWLVIREGKVFVATVEPDATLDELAGLGPDWSSASLWKDRLLLMDKQHSCVLYDLTSKRVATTIPMQSQLWGVGDSHFLLQDLEQTSERGFRFGAIRSYDSETGTPRSKLDSPEARHGFSLSPDGRIFVLGNKVSFVFSDPETGRALWTLPDAVREDGRPIVGRIRFEQASSVVAMDYLNLDGTHQTARWNAADGRVIAPRQSVVREVMKRSVDPTERFALAERKWVKPPLQIWLETRIERVRGLFRNPPLRVEPFILTTELVDHASDRAYGILAPGEVDAMFSPDGSACVTAVEADFQLRYYRLPPSKDWGWLVRYGIGPAALIAGGGWFLRWRRRASRSVEAELRVGCVTKLELESRGRALLA